MLNWEGVRDFVERNSFRLGRRRPVMDPGGSHQGLTVQRGRTPEKLDAFLLHYIPQVYGIRVLLRTGKCLWSPFPGPEGI
jgi:hypothetical protein